MPKKKNWIADATKNKGRLHKDLGVPEDKPIPADALDKAAARDDVVGKRARLAKTLKKLNK